MAQKRLANAYVNALAAERWLADLKKECQTYGSVRQTAVSACLANFAEAYKELREARRLVAAEQDKNKDLSVIELYDIMETQFEKHRN